jgi:hypothetical protein
MIEQKVSVFSSQNGRIRHYYTTNEYGDTHVIRTEIDDNAMVEQVNPDGSVLVAPWSELKQKMKERNP